MSSIKESAEQDLFLYQAALDIVIASSEAQDLCKRLVHSDLFAEPIRGAYVYTLNKQSNLAESAGYGEPITEGLNEIPLWDENPASNSVRTKDVSFELGEESSGNPAVFALPLLLDGVPVGSLVLVLSPRTKTAPVPESIAGLLGKLIAFFLDAKGFTSEPKSSAGLTESIEDLTTRQVSILSFMGDGLTNAEISTKVLLSESTVRQETIRIYRALACTGRHEAVAKARSLGLIPKAI